MKLFAFALFSALALLAVLTNADPVFYPSADDEYACKSKSHAVAKAIHKFCGKTDIMVPSNYAGQGKVGGENKGAWVNIAGTCSPKQWVPKEVCFKQFHHICADGNSRGQGTRHYGRNSCQTWTISH